VIDEQVRFERPIQLFQKTVGHWRTGKSQFAHAGDIGADELGVMDEVMIERRNQIEIRHSLSLDSRKSLSRVVAR